MKFLVAGLGNIGPDYAHTRHNIGFHVLEVLAGTSSAFFIPERYADRAEFRHKGKIFVLIRPTTFMNLSGKAVRYWMGKENVPAERLLVITDDLALPFGKIRIRGKGSDGGHNGLRNITETLGTDEFPRLRFGIGNPSLPGAQVDYVLGKWTPDEEKLLPERIKLASEAVLSFGLQGIDRTMTEYNR